MREQFVPGDLVAHINYDLYVGIIVSVRESGTDPMQIITRVLWNRNVGLKEHDVFYLRRVDKRTNDE